ncbi:MAG: flavodoxin domain-containing protein [Solirubrobacterales bacterium]
MKVLVAYASKRGSTAGIAETVAAEISRCGFDVDCRDSGEVKTLDPYDAVVLGSAVYMKRWRGDAKHFLRHHHKELAKKPFWIFSSGPVGDPAKDNPDWAEPPRIVEKAEQLGVRDHAVFGGSLPEEPHGMTKGMVESTPPEFRDRRDWDQIRAWAKGIAAQLSSVPA